MLDNFLLRYLGKQIGSIVVLNYKRVYHEVSDVISHQRCTKMKRDYFWSTLVPVCACHKDNLSRMTLISHFKTNYLGRKYEALSMMSFYLIMTKNDRRCENPFLLFPFTRNMGVVTSLVAMVSLSRIKPDDVTKLFEPRLFFFSLLS